MRYNDNGKQWVVIILGGQGSGTVVVFFIHVCISIFKFLIDCFLKAIIG